MCLPRRRFGHDGGEAAEHEALGVDEHPVLLDLRRLDRAGLGLRAWSGCSVESGAPYRAGAPAGSRKSIVGGNMIPRGGERPPDRIAAPGQARLVAIWPMRRRRLLCSSSCWSRRCSPCRAARDPAAAGLGPRARRWTCGSAPGCSPATSWPGWRGSRKPASRLPCALGHPAPPPSLAARAGRLRHRRPRPPGGRAPLHSLPAGGELPRRRGLDALRAARAATGGAGDAWASACAGVRHLGTYNCRNVGGAERGRRSQHATANALDIAGLHPRRRAQRWACRATGTRPARPAPSCAAARDAACRVFATVLGPGLQRRPPRPLPPRPRALAGHADEPEPRGGPIAVIGASGRSGAALCRALPAAGMRLPPGGAGRRSLGRDGPARGAPSWRTSAIRPALRRRAGRRGRGWSPAPMRATRRPSSPRRPPDAPLVLMGSTRRFSRWRDAHGDGVRRGRGGAAGQRPARRHPAPDDDLRRRGGGQRAAPCRPAAPPAGGAPAGRRRARWCSRCTSPTCTRSLVAALRRDWDGAASALVVARPRAAPLRRLPAPPSAAPPASRRRAWCRCRSRPSSRSRPCCASLPGLPARAAPTSCAA